jgi:hypothetical protein
MWANIIWRAADLLGCLRDNASSFVNEYRLTAPRWPALVSVDRNRQRGQRLSVAELRPRTRVRRVLSVEESKRLAKSAISPVCAVWALRTKRSFDHSRVTPGVAACKGDLQQHH